MTAAVPFPLPPGRALAAWGRELGALRPRRLRLAHLLLHRVEALVRVTAARRLDRFDAALLCQLAAGAAPERLGMDRGALGRWSHALAADGLIESGAGGPRLTEKGRAALEAGAYTAAAEERRGFAFVDGAGGRPPAFLALRGQAAPLTPPPGWRFDPATLEDCLLRPPEWKARHGFPPDVEAFIAPPRPPLTAADWRRVVLDRPEQILLVFIAPDDAARADWLGYAVRPEGWTLRAEEPAVALAAESGGPEALPELADEPPPAAWQGAWREWCAGRALAAADADACRLEVGAEGVQVLVPPEAARLGGLSDEWLIAGSGRVYVAAPLEIREAP